MRKLFIILFTFSLLFSLAQQHISVAHAKPEIREWEKLDANGKVIQNESCTVDGVPTLQCLEVVYNNLLIMSSGFVLLALFIMLGYGAFQFITAMGDTEKITGGMSTIKYALIGIGLFAVSYLVLFIIDEAFLGGQGKIFDLKIPGPNTGLTP
ncbi:MAG: hypothetical protein WCJ70_04540 [bacterium]